MSGLGLERVSEAGDFVTLNEILATIARNFEQVNNVLGTIAELDVRIGTGSPETVVTASPGAVYINRSGGAGTTLYMKESGVGTNTGWIGK